jgi:hypothetical protein
MMERHFCSVQCVHYCHRNIIFLNSAKRDTEIFYDHISHFMLHTLVWSTQNTNKLYCVVSCSGLLRICFNMNTIHNRCT